MKESVTIAVLTLLFMLVFILPCSADDINLQSQTITVEGYTAQLRVPEQMQLEFVASIPGARFLTGGPDGELLIGSSGPEIYRLKSADHPLETLVSLTGKVHSIAYVNGKLFAAETAGIYAAQYNGNATPLQGNTFKLISPLPADRGGHWSRTIVAGPDSRLYIGLGISGNCSDEYLDPGYPFERQRGGVFVFDPAISGGELSPYASGLRNPIGLAFHPTTSVLYATNAGPDHLGYDQPPEIFTALSAGSFHGMPWFFYYSGTFHEGECASSLPPKPASEAKPPLALFPARSTPEGIAFVKGSSLGAPFTGHAVVAIHGSWAVRDGGDRSSRREPKIVLVHFSENSPSGEVSDLVTGFQRSDGSRFARPCGMHMGGDGNLYFTSDGGEVMGLFRLVKLKNGDDKPGPRRGQSLPAITPLLLDD